MRKTVALLNRIAFVQAAHHGGRQRPTAIVVRTSWTTDDSGAAYGIARAWYNPNNRVDSCHYVVDEEKAIRCVPDKLVAFHTDPPIKGVLSINVCHNPPEPPKPTTVEEAAKLTAKLCKQYRIPVKLLTLEERSKLGVFKFKHRGGIILETVGSFPAEHFLAIVQLEYDSI